MSKKSHVSNKSHISEARLRANRANAQKSTGPRTLIGKAISRTNALTHGLTGRIVFLTSQERESYDELSTALMEDLRPHSALEMQICRNIVDTHFRLSRARSVEDAMFS